MDKRGIDNGVEKEGQVLSIFNKHVTEFNRMYERFFKFQDDKCE